MVHSIKNSFNSFEFNSFSNKVPKQEIEQLLVDDRVKERFNSVLSDLTKTPRFYKISEKVKQNLGSLSAEEIEHLEEAIAAKRVEIAVKAKEVGAPIYISSKVSGLARSLDVSPDGRVILYLNKKTRSPERTGSDPLLGRGTFKVVTKAIDMDTGEMFAAAATSPYEARIEEKELAPFVGEKGFPQIVHKVTYFSLKKEEMRTRLLFPIQYEGQEFRGNLADAQKLLSKEEIELVFKKLVKALKVMQDKNLVHLDIKLENILIYGSGESIEPIYIDFGISNEQDQEVEGFGGTFGGIAPEYYYHTICKGEDFVATQALAIYGLGRAFFSEIEPLKQNKDMRALFSAMCDYNPEKRPSIDQLLARIATIERSRLIARLFPAKEVVERRLTI